MKSYVKAIIIFNENGEPLEVLNHAMMKFSFLSEMDFPPNSIIRKAVK